MLMMGVAYLKAYSSNLSCDYDIIIVYLGKVLLIVFQVKRNNSLRGVILWYNKVAACTKAGVASQKGIKQAITGLAV